MKDRGEERGGEGARVSAHSSLIHMTFKQPLSTVAPHSSILHAPRLLSCHFSRLPPVLSFLIDTFFPTLVSDFSSTPSVTVSHFLFPLAPLSHIDFSPPLYSCSFALSSFFPNYLLVMNVISSPASSSSFSSQWPQCFFFFFSVLVESSQEDRRARISQTERQPASQAGRQEGWILGNGFINSPITTIISLEIWRSPGEPLKGACWPDEGPRGDMGLCVWWDRQRGLKRERKKIPHVWKYSTGTVSFLNDNSFGH